MKKRLIMTLFLLVGILSAPTKGAIINFSVRNDNPPIGHGGIPKSPVQVPIVDLEDHTLYFTTSCVGDTLQLVQNDVVVYSTIITSNEVELPATLEGEFELQIIHGNWLFYGDIEL